MIDHKEERKERTKFETMEERRIKAFQKKKEKEALREKIHYLFENGMSATDISNELHLPVSKVLAYKATRS